MLRLALAPLVILMASCSDSTPTGPSQAAPSASSTPFEVVGNVNDTSTFPVAEATVELLNGPQSGGSTVTGSVGTFSFLVRSSDSFPLSIRVTKAGYHPATRVVERPDSPRTVVHFRLESVAPSVDLAGTYTLTLDAQTGCTQIPAEMRRRSYRVRLVPTTPTIYDIRPLEGEFLAFRMYAGVAGNFVAFDTASDWSTVGIAESLTPTSTLLIWGWGSTNAASASNIVVPFGGSFSHCPATVSPSNQWRCPVIPSTCPSERLTLTPF
jgi:hypothetical protein